MLTTKKKEILPLATTWMELEGIMLSEISQINTNIVWYHLYMESKKKKRNSYKQRKTGDCQRGEWSMGDWVRWSKSANFQL